MSRALRSVGEGEGGPPPCAICGDLAAGPCARCRRPVCADCCELSEGGVKTFALCRGCVRRGGRSLKRGWLGLLAWALGLAALLVALGLGLLLLRH